MVDVFTRESLAERRQAFGQRMRELLHHLVVSLGTAVSVAIAAPLTATAVRQ
jgi:hypothetical protein